MFSDAFPILSCFYPEDLTMTHTITLDDGAKADAAADDDDSISANVKDNGAVSNLWRV